MGVSKHRSWSHSRQRAYDECPRRWFWEYFAWDEPEEEQARFLKRLQTVPQLAGTHVHDAIEIALRQYRFAGVWPSGLAERALSTYWEDVAQSARVARAVHEDRSPDRVGALLDAHLYGVATAEALQKGADGVRKCVENLEASGALCFLLGTRTKDWKHISTRIHAPTFVEVSPRLEMPSAMGLRLYTAFDLALEHEGVLYILDWKTGRSGAASAIAARAQLAAYALWGMASGVEAGRIHTQAVWLGDGPPEWEPTPVSPAELADLRESVQRQDALEKALLTTEPVRQKSGAGFRTVDQYRAHRDAFPPAPSDRACGGCKFFTMCAERTGRPAAIIGAEYASAL